MRIHSELCLRVPRYGLQAALLLALCLLTVSTSTPISAQQAERTVTGLTLSSDEPGSLTIHWDAASPAPVDYRVSWARSDEEYLTWTNASGNAFPTTNSLSLSGLDEGVEYKVQVRARYGTDGSGPWSDEATLAVAATEEVVGETGMPTNGGPGQTVAEREVVGLSLLSDEPGSLTIHWDAASPAPVDYRVSWARSDEEYLTWTNASGNAFPTTNSLFLSGLDEGVEYKVQVRARYGTDGSGPWSDEARLTVAEEVPPETANSEDNSPNGGGDPPAAPTGLRITDAGSRFVSMRWDDSDDSSITGYQILRREPAVHEPGHFEVHLANTGSTDSTHTDRDIEHFTEYVYRVTAINEHGISEPSNAARGTSDGVTPLTNLRITDLGNDSVTLAWDTPQDVLETYEHSHTEILRRIPAVHGSDYYEVFITDEDEWTHSYTDRDVVSGATYTYCVRSYLVEFDDRSACTDWVEVELPLPDGTDSPTPPDSPTGLQSYDIGPESLSIKWDDLDDDTIAAYRVWRRDRDADSEDETSPFEIIATSTSYSGFSYTDTDVEASRSYAYAVSAISDNGAVGSRSVELHVDTPVVQALISPAYHEDLGDFTSHGSSGHLTGTVDSADVSAAYYRFELDEVRHVTISLTQDSPDADVTLEYAESSVLIAGGSVSDGASQEIGIILRAGMYRIRVLARTGSVAAYALGYQVNGNIPEERTGADLPGEVSSMARLHVDGIIRGTAHFEDDYDWYGVQLEAGVQYLFVTRGTGGPNYSPEAGLPWATDLGSACVDYIYDESGQEVFPGPYYCDDFTWRPGKSGLYFLEISADLYRHPRNGSRNRDYTLAVKRVIDDYGESIHSHGTIEVGGSVIGSIDWMDPWNEMTDQFHLRTTVDMDWFAFDAVKGRVYEIVLKPAQVEGSLLGMLPDVMLPRVRDPYGDVVAGTRGTPFGPRRDFTHRLLFPPTTTDTYYAVAATDDLAAFVGDYQMSLTDITPTEPDIPGDTSTTARLEIGGPPVRSWLTSTTDQDWFVVNLETGKSYEIRLERGLAQVLTIEGIRYGEEKTMRGSKQVSNDFEDQMSLVFTPTMDGDFYIDVGNTATYGAWLDAGDYSIAVKEVESIDNSIFSEYTSNAKPLTLDSWVRGKIIPPPGDYRAWHSITLEEGKAYETEIEKAYEWCGAGVGGNLSQYYYRRGVYDSSGSILENSDIGQIVVTETGTYYIRVGGRTGAKTCGYTIKVKEVEPHVKPTPPPSPEQVLFESRLETTISQLNPGESANGEIVDVDSQRDWYQIELAGGGDSSYWIELFGSKLPGNTLGRPLLLAVFDADGEAIYMWEDRTGGGFPRTFQLNPERTGTYYIVVQGVADLTTGGDGTGTYTILVTDTTPQSSDGGTSGGSNAQSEPHGDDLPAATTTAGQVGVGIGAHATGNIDGATDVDWFAVDLEANVSYQIDMEGSWTGHIDHQTGEWVGMGTLFDPMLAGIYDKNGDQIEGTDVLSSDDAGDGKNARLMYTPGITGSYYIGVTGSGWTGTYRLSVHMAE